MCRRKQVLESIGIGTWIRSGQRKHHEGDISVLTWVRIHRESRREGVAYWSPASVTPSRIAFLTLR